MTNMEITNMTINTANTMKYMTAAVMRMIAAIMRMTAFHRTACHCFNQDDDRK